MKTSTWEVCVQRLKGAHQPEEQELRVQHRRDDDYLCMQCSQEAEGLESQIQNFFCYKHKEAELQLKGVYAEQRTYLKREIQSRNKALITEGPFPYTTDRVQV